MPKRPRKDKKDLVYFSYSGDDKVARQFIKQWRLHRGYTQEELAQKIDRTGPSISLIENGNAPYTQTILESIANSLECSPVDLISVDPRLPEKPEDKFLYLFRRMTDGQHRLLYTMMEAMTEENKKQK